MPKKAYNNGAERVPRDGSHYTGDLEYGTFKSSAIWVREFIKANQRGPTMDEIVQAHRLGKAPFSRAILLKRHKDSIHCFFDEVEKFLSIKIPNRSRLPGDGSGEFGQKFKIDKLISRYETAETNPSEFYPLVDEKVVMLRQGEYTTRSGKKRPKMNAFYKMKATLKEGEPVIVRQCAQLLPTKKEFIKRKIISYAGRKELLPVINEIELPEYCPYLKRLFNIEPKLQYHGYTQCVPKDGTGVNGLEDIHAPSLDKIHPVEGYILGNVEITSWFWNRMKSDNSTTHLFKKLGLELNEEK